MKVSTVLWLAGGLVVGYALYRASSAAADLEAKSVGIASYFPNPVGALVRLFTGEDEPARATAQIIEPVSFLDVAVGTEET